MDCKMYWLRVVWKFDYTDLSLRGLVTGDRIRCNTGFISSAVDFYLSEQKKKKKAVQDDGLL